MDTRREVGSHAIWRSYMRSDAGICAWTLLSPQCELNGVVNETALGFLEPASSSVNMRTFTHPFKCGVRVRAWGEWIRSMNVEGGSHSLGRQAEEEKQAFECRTCHHHHRALSFGVWGCAEMLTSSKTARSELAQEGIVGMNDWCRGDV